MVFPVSSPVLSTDVHQALDPPKVLIVGHGFMGANHRKKVETLQANGKANLVCLVDTDSSKLTALNVPTASTLKEAFDKTLPNIVVICANTKNHFALLSNVIDLSKKYGCAPDILIEKPLVANSKEGAAVKEMLSSYKGRISSGYLFRQSPIIDESIKFLRSHHLKIKTVSTVWQKDRLEKGPARPSEGVHIDESTHPMDLILNCILPESSIQVNGVTLFNTSFKRQSEVGPIVDQKKQEELYADDLSKLDPIAEVSYEMEASGIPVSGFSSFKKAPQRREITLECTGGIKLLFEFDVKGADRLFIISKNNEKTLLFESEKDKLMLEWESFLEYCQTGKESYRIQTLRDMLFDIRLTEALGEKLEFPHEIKK